MEQKTENITPDPKQQTGLSVRTQLRAGDQAEYEACMSECLPRRKTWPACWNVCDPYLDE